jgi:hypothetical protein
MDSQAVSGQYYLHDEPLYEHSFQVYKEMEQQQEHYTISALRMLSLIPQLRLFRNEELTLIVTFKVVKSVFRNFA